MRHPWKLLSLFSLLSVIGIAQDHGFKYGQVSWPELSMKTYENDTSAVAVVLREFGEAYIDAESYNLIFKYHVRIKILKQRAAERANIEIPLYRQGGKDEKVEAIKASSFNAEGGSIRESKVDSKNVFRQSLNKSWDVYKFAIPNVKEGTVIEYQYDLESPYVYNFRSWIFQSDIPKVESEYWASIPGNYIYNTTIRGFLKLSKNESEIIPRCLVHGTASADCARYKYAMKNIPALIEEDHMTARSNFLAAINFELSVIKHFDGRVDKVTKEWKDAEQELRIHEDFGHQLRRGADVVDKYLEVELRGENDPLNKAKKIYNFVRKWYEYDGARSKYCEFGIRKAFESKKGNVGDINLTLLAALRYAGLNVEPVILSTRDNGLPIDIHPVLSDFNYVVAKLNVGDKVYLLDATDDFVPFGILPKHCLNGKGRALGEKGSYWVELKPAEKEKEVTMLTLGLDEDGRMKGTILHTYYGYAAIDKRKAIDSFDSEQEYINSLKNKMSGSITGFTLSNFDDITLPLTEKIEVDFQMFDDLTADNLLMNPFITGRQKANPFKSSQRLYPVDFAVPIEHTTIISIDYPGKFELSGRPEKVALTLPNSGGRYLFGVEDDGKKVIVNNVLSISKTVYSSQEYHSLKELFNRVIQTQNIDLVFKKKL